MNLLKTLEDRMDIRVSTTRKSNSLLEFVCQRSLIYHNVRENKADCSIIVLIKYLLFSILTLLQLIRYKPDVLLYYESISALPAYLYKFFFRKRIKLCIHYHEYMTPDEYNRPGMRLSKYNHHLETSYLYKKAVWISQTNEYRKNFFLKDYPYLQASVCHVMPNYPPKKWHRKQKKHKGDVVKCVYVGSLSLCDTYILEFCKWVNSQQGKVKFDIYSFNFHKETLDAVEKIHSPYISFYKEGIKYDEIPNLLDGYDVGVLLYKAQTMNVMFCETNKFYEYLICGLDVWYPTGMTLLHEMDKSIYAPKIVEIDFCKDIFPDIDTSVRLINNICYNQFCERVYLSFHEQILFKTI